MADVDLGHLRSGLGGSNHQAYNIRVQAVVCSKLASRNTVSTVDSCDGLGASTSLLESSAGDSDSVGLVGDPIRRPSLCHLPAVEECPDVCVK